MSSAVLNNYGVATSQFSRTKSQLSANNNYEYCTQPALDGSLDIAELLATASTSMNTSTTVTTTIGADIRMEAPASLSPESLALAPSAVPPRYEGGRGRRRGGTLESGYLAETPNVYSRFSSAVASPTLPDDHDVGEVAVRDAHVGAARSSLRDGDGSGGGSGTDGADTVGVDGADSIASTCSADSAEEQILEFWPGQRIQQATAEGSPTATSTKTPTAPHSRRSNRSSTVLVSPRLPTNAALGRETKEGRMLVLSVQKTTVL
jgi:hypothetical protein